jgi:hypothetical protein
MELNYFNFLLLKVPIKCISNNFIIYFLTGTGRVLHPEHFANEIYLRFNLPPLHSLQGKFIPDMVKREIISKDYIRKGDADERSQRKFKFAHLSASVGNFRAKEEDKYAGGIEMNLQNSATSSNK